MVTPAMQEQPQVIYGPNGERAEWNGREYVVASQAAPSRPASGGGYTLQPLTTPADRRAEDDRDYRRQRDTVSDSREERRLELAEQAAARAEAAANKNSESATSRRALQNAERTYLIVRDDIRRALDIADGWTTGIPGIVGRQVPGTEARDLAALVDTIKANIGFDYLSAMRQSSPTGGALGNVSNIENELLQATSGNLDVGQSAQQLRRNLERIDETMMRSFSQAISQYEANGGTWDGSRPDAPAGAGDQSAGGPGADPNDPFDFTTASRDEVIAAIQRGGWFRNGPDGEPYQLPPANPEFGMQEGDEAVAPGVAMRPRSEGEVRAQTAEDRSAAGTGLFRKADAAIRGAADFLTFGQSDEIAAGLDTFRPLNGGQMGWTNGFPEAYRNNLARERGVADADAEDVPFSRGAGQVAGGLMFAPRAAAGLAGRSLLSNTVRGTAAGAGYGGAYGFGSGEGNALERAPDAAAGAGWGALGGAAAPSLVNVGGRVLSPVGNALADGARTIGRPIVNALGDAAPQSLQRAVAPNALERGLERFAGTNRPDINAINATRSQLEGAVERPVAAANAINTGGRAMLRGLATRSDRARESAENFGQGAVEALPARVGAQGRRILSDDPRSPDQVRQSLIDQRRTNAASDYGAIEARVPVGDDLLEAIGDEPGRAALRAARADAVERRDTSQVAELDSLLQEIDLGGQLRSMGVNASRVNRDGLEVSALTLERIRAAMGERGGRFARAGRNARASGALGRRDDIEGAMDSVSEMAAARGNYRDASRQIEAVDAGEQFMSANPDAVAASMRGAPESAQAPFRAGAVRSIERAAGTTGAAPGVANRLAIPGTPQRQMMDETLGADDAGRLATAMRGERDIYRGAQQVDPGVGSQTSNNLLKAGEAAGLAGDVFAGRPLSAVRRVVGMLDSRGFNPQQAEAVVEAMTDPSRTDEVIRILSDRMSRREARRLTRALRYQLTIAPQSGPQP